MAILTIKAQGARMGRYFSALSVILTFCLASEKLHAQQAAGEPSYDQSGVILEKDILPGAPKIVLIAGSKSHGPMEHEFFAATAILQKRLRQTAFTAIM